MYKVTVYIFMFINNDNEKCYVKKKSAVLFICVKNGSVCYIFAQYTNIQNQFGTINIF